VNLNERIIANDAPIKPTRRGRRDGRDRKREGIQTTQNSPLKTILDEYFRQSGNERTKRMWDAAQPFGEKGR